ncbi:MAG: radical SAM family heme chaperone HemW [Thermoleophilia bacterium]|nr:radical SAM family heme chaperone HemW [Thermoleophilia bacterium]
MPRHLYVHVPFCRSRCSYCDFASEPIGPHMRAGRVAAYVAALRAQLERESPCLGLPLETAYLGGGTPTSLPPDLLFPLVQAVARLVERGGEFTVETTPSTADERTLAGLREAGATRLSLGVQSFAPALRRALGRRCTDAELDLALTAVRDSGFEEWNVDLIFGIPGQSWEQAQADLRAAAAVHPTHISLYDLTYTTHYAAGVATESGPAARDEAAAFAEEHYADATVLLESAGYRRYEVSNYALPGHECRHNLAYWRGDDYLGIGASAVSTLGLARRMNPGTVAAYLAGDRPEIEPLTAEIRLFERAMLGLRTTEGVRENEVAPILDQAAAALMIERGYVRRAYATLSLSPNGLDLSSAILATILRLPGEHQSM